MTEPFRSMLGTFSLKASLLSFPERKPSEMMPKSFYDYLVKVAEELTRYPELRVGQAYYNVLYKVRIDIARLLIDAKRHLDPFYDDGKLTAFLAFVRGNWGEK